jgi:phospholipid/cholesterol/gamma-HCH transport system ATP-binding protein
MPAQLSGGQRKRVALARAVVLQPQVVLYDEPTTGLDPIRADLINELIISQARRTGITSVVVTHDMASATKIADRIVMLYDGRIVADADAATFTNLKDDLVQRFIQGRADREELRRIREGFHPG